VESGRPVRGESAVCLEAPELPKLRARVRFPSPPSMHEPQGLASSPPLPPAGFPDVPKPPADRDDGPPATVLDICCSYGINAALLNHHVTLEELYDRYTSPKLSLPDDRRTDRVGPARQAGATMGGSLRAAHTVARPLHARLRDSRARRRHCDCGDR
jgi:hypothetical protein